MTSNAKENIINVKKNETVTQNLELSEENKILINKNLNNLNKNNENNLRDKKENNMSYINLILNNGKEALCFFALILTTCASLHSNPQKISRPPTPRPFFSNSDIVHDSLNGNLNQTYHFISSSELSLIFYYAPWCAESQQARKPFTDVAQIFSKEIYFGAVNCWQPGGECRLHHNKVQKWPVLMAYFPNDLSVQYYGTWTYSSMIKFVNGLIKPFKRFHSPEDLLKATVGCDAVVVGFIDMKKNLNEYYTFYQTAIKWLERDPYQEITFGIVTGDSFKLFGVDYQPSMRMYLWNETIEFRSKDGWNRIDITKWILDHMQQVSLWLAPPGHKSSSLSPYLKQGPVLLLFTPRNLFANLIDGYGLLRQLGLEYYNCAKDDWILEMATDYIPYQRIVNYNEFIKLTSMCKEMYENESKSSFEKNDKCYEISVTFGNILNTSKSSYLLKHMNMKELDYDLNNKSYKSQQNDYCTPKTMNNKINQPISLECNKDLKSVECLKEIDLKRKCDFLRLSERDNSPLFFTETEQDKSELESISGLACEMNKTFSLIAIDSVLYHTFAERLGIDILTIKNKSAAIIIDTENESTYLLNESITTSSLTRFLNNYIKGSLPRYLRSDSVQYKHTHFYNFEYPNNEIKKNSHQKLNKKSKTIRLKEVYSENFEELVIKSNKTVVTLFYSSQCAFCGIMSQHLLTISNILKKVQTLDFVRIDGDKNDLAWFYTMSVFPTLIIFPGNNRKSESRVFPNDSKVTMKNLLGFILANLDRPTRLYAIALTCKVSKKFQFLEDCMGTLRQEISNDISFSLKEWRRFPHIRRHIIKRLSILQNLYLKLFNGNSNSNNPNQEMDKANSLEINAKILMKLWSSNYNN